MTHRAWRFHAAVPDRVFEPRTAVGLLHPPPSENSLTVPAESSGRACWGSAAFTSVSKTYDRSKKWFLDCDRRFSEKHPSGSSKLLHQELDGRDARQMAYRGTIQASESRRDQDAFRNAVEERTDTMISNGGRRTDLFAPAEREPKRVVPERPRWIQIRGSSDECPRWR